MNYIKHCNCIGMINGYLNAKIIENTIINRTKISTSVRLMTTYCLENVKRHDYENFLSTLLLPSDSREGAFAIRAFNTELALIRDATQEELTARMRFQFWREALDKIYVNKPQKHPVVYALHKAKLKHKLPKKWLKNMIDAREDNLTNMPFMSVDALETYSEKSNSAIYYLILQCMGINDVEADHAASHIGKSEGIAKLIRGIPHHGSKRIVLVPTPLMAAHKVSQQDVIRGKNDQKMKDLIFELASLAYQHLDHAKQLDQKLSKDAKVAFLPAVNVSTYLRALQLRDFDVFDAKLQKRSGLLPIKLWWAKFRNTYW